MIYFGEKAVAILKDILEKKSNLKVEGYFKDKDIWVCFDNRSGDCWVEEFKNEYFAIGWLYDLFQYEEDVHLLKIFSNFFYIYSKGFVRIKKNNSEVNIMYYPFL